MLSVARSGDGEWLLVVAVATVSVRRLCVGLGALKTMVENEG